MNVEPFTLREFSAGIAVKAPVPGKPFVRGKGKEEVPLPSSYSEEQLKAAERESYKKGFLEGIEDGKKQQVSEQEAIDRKLSQAVDTFAGTISPILADYRSVVLQMRQDLPKIALCIAQKVAGNALGGNAQSVIDDVAQRCVEIMIGEPKLTIAVHPSLAPTLKAKLDTIVVRMQVATDIIVNGDESIPEADCRIEWRHGAFARNTEKLWESVRHAVENLSAYAKHETETQLNALEAQVQAKPVTNTTDS